MFTGFANKEVGGVSEEFQISSRSSSQTAGDQGARNCKDMKTVHPAGVQSYHM